MSTALSQDLRCDIAFVGGGLRTITMLSSMPELLEYDIAVIDASGAFGSGALADCAVPSNSIGSKFFQFVRQEGVFGDLLREPRVAQLAACRRTVELTEVGSALERFGSAVQAILGPSRALLRCSVAQIEVNSGSEYPFELDLSTGGRVRARIAVIATGRTELISPLLEPWCEKTWMSARILSGRRRPELQHYLESIAGGSITIVGGSHSAFSALGVLADCIWQLLESDAAYHPPMVTVAHRSPICLYYDDVEQALRDQVLGRERIFDPEKDVCPKTGAVFRDSGLRYAAKELCLTIWTGTLPYVRLERIASESDLHRRCEQSDRIVQALGYRSRVFPLVADGRPLWTGNGSDKIRVARDGRLLLQDAGPLSDLPIFGLRLVQTPKDQRDNANDTGNAYERLGESLQERLALGGCRRRRVEPHLSSGFSRNTTPRHAALRSGEGAWVRDSEGREYLDCCAQTLNMNLGQCHPEVLEAVEEQARRLTYASSRFASDTTVALHEKLIAITPEPLSRINMKCVSGSTANECALKAVRKKTGRKLVISLEGSHLGQTLETMRVSGKHWMLDYLGERHARFVPAPYCYRCPFGKKPDSCDVECLDPVDDVWKRERGDVAAVILEPIMVDAGVLVPPKKYHERLRRFCDDHDVALVYDEVQTAFGWLGVMFAMELYGTTPDLLSLGKGLGAGFPLAASIFREPYDVLTYGEHEMTYGGHPVSCAASLAMIGYLEADGRLQEIGKKGSYVRQRLESLSEKYPAIGDVRGVGLLLGIEVVDPSDGRPDPERAARIFETMLEEGVLLRLSKVGENCSVLQFKPPVVIGYEDLDLACDKLEDALRSHSWS